MPSLYFVLSNWLNYHKGFSIMAIVIENNRILCLIYCSTIGDCCPDWELYVVKFTVVNSNINLVFERLLYSNPLLDW